MDPFRTTLADGTEAWIRTISADDKSLLVEGLSRLSVLSAYQRFLTPVRSLSPRELSYLTEVDGHSHVALVAVRPDGPAPLLAVARAVRTLDDAGAAEVAIVVRDDVQRLGLGRTLLRALCEAARANGVSRITATILESNRPARRLFEQVATHVRCSPPVAGVVEMHGNLEPTIG